MEEITVESLTVALNELNIVHMQWARSTDYDDTEKSVDLFMQCDDKKKVFKKLALPIKFDHVAYKYFFDIPCSLKDWLGC